MLHVIAGLLGPVALVLGMLQWLFAKREARRLHQALEGQDPHDLLGRNEKNFKLHVSEIRTAVFEPRSIWATHHQVAGQLRLIVRHGEKLKLELPTPAELATALQLLQPLLRSVLVVNVVWDQKKQRFEKKRQ